MDRTLFSSPMIETFRACRRAYQFAFGSEQVDKISLSAICKRFLLRALSEIHRGRITTLAQVQKYLGQHWPTDKFLAEGDDEHQERAVQAFRFVYRVLTQYITAPYHPRGSEVSGVAMKVRARVPHMKVYLEETFDLILWHPNSATLEIVDFHLHSLKQIDPASPTPSLLVRYFLADRLRQRFPFQKLIFTFAKLSTTGVTPVSFEIEESTFREKWPEIVGTLEEMKSPSDYEPHKSSVCKRCQFLAECTAMDAHQPSSLTTNVGLTA